MGLRDAISSGVAAAFSAIGGLAVSAVITRTIQGTYSATLGTSTGDTSTTITVSGVKIAFRQELIDGTAIHPGDCKLIFPASGLAFDPAPGDQVTINGQTFNVVEARIDPAGAAWVLHLR